LFGRQSPNSLRILIKAAVAAKELLRAGIVTRFNVSATNQKRMAFVTMALRGRACILSPPSSAALASIGQKICVGYCYSFS
jgi:hypothetical protein